MACYALRRVQEHVKSEAEGPSVCQSHFLVVDEKPITRWRRSSGREAIARFNPHAPRLLDQALTQSDFKSAGFGADEVTIEWVERRTPENLPLRCARHFPCEESWIEVSRTTAPPSLTRRSGHG